MAIKTALGAQRYNNRMDKIFQYKKDNPYGMMWHVQFKEEVKREDADKIMEALACSDLIHRISFHNSKPINN